MTLKVLLDSLNLVVKAINYSSHKERNIIYSDRSMSIPASSKVSLFAHSQGVSNISR